MALDKDGKTVLPANIYYDRKKEIYYADKVYKGERIYFAGKTKAEAEKIVEALHKCPYSQNAAIIGEVTAEQPGKVVMTTEIGTQALLPQPGGELLPRIC